MKRVVILVLIIVFITIAGIGSYSLLKFKTQEREPTVQNVVKPDENANWKTATPSNKEVTFKYPDLPSVYILPQQWPPQITLTSGVFSCKEGGLGINGLPGMTIQKTIVDRTYCIESISEIAGGTIYTTYTYTFQKDNKLVKLEFVLAYQQCDNYEVSNKTECVNERQTFDLDSLVDRITQTVAILSE